MQARRSLVSWWLLSPSVEPLELLSSVEYLRLPFIDDSGFIASKMDRPYKRVFIAALILDITANVIYVLTRNLWGILAGRFLSGFSSGMAMLRYLLTY